MWQELNLCGSKRASTWLTVMVLVMFALVGVNAESALADGASSNAFGEEAALIDVGGSHSCKVLEHGSVRCWGGNANGQLGYGNTVDIGDNEAPASAGPVNVGTGRSATAVTVGDSHTCAILDDGTVSCWGLGSEGQLGYGNTSTIGNDETPGTAGSVNLGSGRTATQISAGSAHTCALLDDGTVRCWGRAAEGQLGYGNTTTIGDTESPADAGPVDLGAGRFATAISSGANHTCAVLDDGTVRCWGEGASGRLGYGNTTTIGDTETPGTVGPVDLGTDRSATAISAGDSHTCALLDNGNLRCWGNAAAGRLGYGNTTDIGDTEAPAAAGPVNLSGRSANAVTAGGAHTCARLDNGTTRCWGEGDLGRLGYGNTVDIGDNETPAAVGAINVGANRRVVAISAGSAHTCARLDDGKVRCWGDGSVGRLGYGNLTVIGNNEEPGTVGPVNLGPDPRVALARSATEVVAADKHTCALLDDGNVRCWGHHEEGRLGNGSTEDIGDTEVPGSGSPVDLGNGRTATRIAAGANQTCALLDNGNVVCWGGGGGVAQVSLGANRTAVDVDAGESHACAVLSDGDVRCWGSGDSGQLGHGNTEPIGDPGSLAPVDLGFNRFAVQIQAAGSHTCAILDNGKLLCWGSNGSGELGYPGGENVGDDESPGSAGAVGLDNETTQISLASGVTCARLADGRARCWGSDSDGRLGNGAAGDIDTPASADALVDFGAGVTATQLAAGGTFACARLGSGDDKCWGGNKNGQLGAATTTNNYPDTSDTDAPGPDAVNVGSDLNAFGLAAGDTHSCVVLGTRQIRCWGFGEGGRLGYGNIDTIGDDEVPADVGTVDFTDTAPTAVGDAKTMVEDAPATTIDVLSNDTDPDGGELRITDVTQPAQGTVAIAGGGSQVTYKPDADYCNSPGGPLDTFTYRLNGGSTATVTVTVTCVDDNPRAVNDSATVPKDAAATAIPVLANDTDPDGGPLAITAASDPANGQVTVANGGTGLSYKPDPDYCNTAPNQARDTFTYTLNGGSTATVSVAVTCGPDEPPDTFFSNTPDKKIKTKKKRVSVRFGFISSEVSSTFECRLDKDAFVACTSPQRLSVRIGKHTFEVRAIDAAGNVDPTPASHKFTVKKKKKRRR